MADTSALLSQFKMQIDGQDVSLELAGSVIDVTVESSLHLPDMAVIRLHDPGLSWVDADELSPGKALSVLTSDPGQAEKPIFDGEIVEVEPEFGPLTVGLTVRAFDRLHRLSRGRQTRTFLNVTDGDVLQKIAQEVGLKADAAPTPQVMEYLLQANESNLHFLQGRAASLGYLLYVLKETLCMKPVKADEPPVGLELFAGLTAFRPRMSTLGQVNKVVVRGWDPKARQELMGESTKGNGVPELGDQKDGGELAKSAFKLEASDLVCLRPIRSQAEADALAQAMADRHASQFVEAEGQCAGTPLIVAGAKVEIRNVGKRFGGVYFVTGATHVFSTTEGYETRFSVSGLHPSTIISLLAPERAPGVPGGLAVGVVTDIQDPDGQGRVKVKYPWLSADHTSHWARVTAVGGGKERGIAFLPEVNDEVLVGFELNDIHHPYILGGLWNGQDALPVKGDEAISGGAVVRRVICSRTGHKITLDDTDGGGGITIEDANGNKLFIDSGSDALSVEIKGDGTLKFEGALTLESQGDISMKAQGGLKLEAQGAVEIKGMGAKLDGGGGTVEIKGSMIDLN